MADDTGAVLVIPAYDPPAELPDLVRRMLAASPTAFTGALVVDDGSAAPARATFAEVERIPRAAVLRRAANSGKGAALKAGFAHALECWPGAIGVVTADADGQHCPDDVARVAWTLVEHPDQIVLGVRRFDRSMPLRNRIGNCSSRTLVGLVTGARLTDTQTGLRGWPRAVAEQSRRLASTGFDFELDALLTFLDVPRIEIPIATIYRDGDRHSHFRPLRDSLRIGQVLWRHSRR